jgi:rare lipoprotein A (peptidoglycan hydrolase)
MALFNRSTTVLRSADDSRSIGFAAFVWVACLALMVYVGTVLYTVRRPAAVEEAAAVVAVVATAPAAVSLPEDQASGTPRPLPEDIPLRGWASWYGPELQGSPTASGEPFDMHALTAAHRTLPLGTLAQIRNLKNGKAVVVRINDRGPVPKRRMIDLSFAAAQKLGMVRSGSALVEILPL